MEKYSGERHMYKHKLKLIYSRYDEVDTIQFIINFCIIMQTK